MSLQEEKEKMQAQKEEVLSHVNDVLENELQCIICSEYFIEVSVSSAPDPAVLPLPPLPRPGLGPAPPRVVHQPSRLLLLWGNLSERTWFRNLELFDFPVMSEGSHFSLHHAVFTMVLFLLDHHFNYNASLSGPHSIGVKLPTDAILS